MPTAPAFQPETTTPARAGGVPKRRVIDAPTRMFHALFALSFLGAYLTADGERWRALHVTLGYTLAGLLAFRVLYGLLGPRHAGLGLMLRKLAGAPAWLRSAAQELKGGSVLAVNWRQGQNLLMALAVLALLGLVLPLTLTGYGSYNDWGKFLGEDGLEDLHEFFGNAFLAVVLAHIGLTVAISLLRRRNQALPMLTGRVQGAGPDLVKHNHAWLAGLLLAAVLAFVSWHWQQAPQAQVQVQVQEPSWPPSDPARHADHHPTD
jgi:cytochrome b